MKISKRNIETIRDLSEVIYDDILGLQEINSSLYSEQGGYDVNKGYGFQIYVLRDVLELQNICSQYQVTYDGTEYFEFLKDDKFTTIKLSYLLSSDSFLVIYLVLSNPFKLHP